MPIIWIMYLDDLLIIIKIFGHHPLLAFKKIDILNIELIFLSYCSTNGF